MNRLLPTIMALALMMGTIPAQAMATTPIASQAETLTDVHELYAADPGYYAYAAGEKVESLQRDGWVDRGVVWQAPATSSIPVYCLHQVGPDATHSEFVYLTSAAERDYLLGESLPDGSSWIDDGIAFYSDENAAAPVYRLYLADNIGRHRYTASAVERDSLKDKGWNFEGTAFSAAGLGPNASVRDMQNATIQVKSTIETGTANYDPIVAVTAKDGAKLLPNRDYEVIYHRASGGWVSSTPPTEQGEYWIELVGTGTKDAGYFGTASAPYRIVATSETQLNKGANVRLMYNLDTKQHLMTGDPAEIARLGSDASWLDEGLAFKAPETGTPMYRLFSPASTEYFYTTSIDERSMLISLGWTYEGVAFFVLENSGVPVYRLYYPTNGDHYYTTSASERDALAVAGWSLEGIGWYVEQAGTVDASAHFCLVDYDLNGGAWPSGNSYPARRDTHVGARVNAPASPVLEGYLFEGWQVDGKAWDFDDPVEGDITLKATWKKDAAIKPSPDPTPEPEQTTSQTDEGVTAEGDVFKGTAAGERVVLDVTDQSDRPAAMVTLTSKVTAAAGGSQASDIAEAVKSANKVFGYEVDLRLISGDASSPARTLTESFEVGSLSLTFEIGPGYDGQLASIYQRHVSQNGGRESVIAYQSIVEAGAVKVTVSQLSDFLIAVSDERPVYRLVNPVTGEHFYTPSASERENSRYENGQDVWVYEGVEWIAPVSGKPIWRMRHKDTHMHYFPSNIEEVELRRIENGGDWIYEGVAFYGVDGVTDTPIYRTYSQSAALHFYTASKDERDRIQSAYWGNYQYEFDAWYAIRSDHK